MSVVERTDLELRRIGGGGGFRGEVLESALGVTAMGLVLATVSERGLCSVALGSEAEQLRQEVRQRFPHAELTDGGVDSVAGRAVGYIARMIEAPGIPLQLALDLRGTEFQQKVWRALLKIPVGETTTYTDIARKIGSPQAVRAVGTACGANRLAVVVPCHRVLSSTGGLSGYRWGLEWKRSLLEKERR